MNPFEPANLSPLPRAPLECALPYILTWDDLRPVLPDFDEGRSARAQAFVSYEKQGIIGGSNSCILTLQYPTGENQLRSETIFIKHAENPEKAEAEKYQFIASHKVPTPHLLAVIHKGGGEIMLLEFLPTIGINFHSSSEVNSLLHLVAQVNSIQNPMELFSSPPRDPQPESNAAFDGKVEVALTEMSNDRTLPVKIDIPRWFDAYLIAQKASNSMPLAVNHGEFYFQQVGWAQRGATRQLVIFDLETMSLRPRFTDIANVLYPLAVYTGRDQVELFEVYLDRLHQLSQPELDIDEALHELRLLRVTESCYSLPWLVDAARQPDDMVMHHLLSMTTNGLFNDLLPLELL